jgi:hypothetical protein
MQFSFIKKLNKEDFKSDIQDTIGKIAFILNPAFQSLQSILNNGLVLNDNFAGMIKTIAVSVDNKGTPTSPLVFKNTSPSKINHIIVTRATNQTNSSVFPISSPFISFTESSGTIIINNIAGLPTNNVFNLTLVALI